MLKGKVAVVTGGTRGIGYAIVKKYLENGAKVVLFGSRDETVNKALAALKEENPDWEVSGYAPNLLDPKALEETIAKIKEQYGRIDILVNNAGISDSTKIDDYTAEQFAKVMDLNVKAIFNAIMPTVKIMKEQGGGCIINTSSMVSISGQPSGVAYPTSKTAVNGLTWSLARELGPSNIRVNALACGVIDTKMNSMLTPEDKKELVEEIPSGRFGTPEEVAKLAWQVANAPSYMTGQIIGIDGGFI